MSGQSRHGIAQRAKSGGGGGPGPTGDRVHRPIGERTLDDVMFSLRIMVGRIRRYDLAGRQEDLAIAWRVTNRLLSEYTALGGKMKSRFSVGLVGGDNPQDSERGVFMR